MAKFVYGLMQSLDGYVDHDAMPAPGPLLFRHYVGLMQSVDGSLYGRRLYELMQFWEQDDPSWPEDHRAFGKAWRDTPKWVVSTTLTEVGPNATLINTNIEAKLRKLKADATGIIEIAGPKLARSLTDLNLIDEYQLYFRPYILGKGAPFFAGPRPPLRLTAHDKIGEDTIRLTYVPA